MRGKAAGKERKDKNNHGRDKSVRWRFIDAVSQDERGAPSGEWEPFGVLNRRGKT